MTIENKQVKVQKAIFNEIKNRAGNKKSSRALVEELAQLLHVSTDSAYRRLRCEKFLTLDELEKISMHFKVSFDKHLALSESDSVIFNADLSSSIIPDSGSTYDLGSNSKWYKHLYVNTISASFISGAIAGIGNLEAFSQSVDNRLDRVEASSSLYDNEMSGSNRLYVSPSGSDSNDGSDPSVPFRTIKAAVEYLGSAVFSNTKRYTIFVGSGNYTEQNPIEVPPGVAIVGDNLRTVRLTAAKLVMERFLLQIWNRSFVFVRMSLVQKHYRRGKWKIKY